MVFEIFISINQLDSSPNHKYKLWIIKAFKIIISCPRIETHALKYFVILFYDQIPKIKSINLNNSEKLNN